MFMANTQSKASNYNLFTFLPSYLDLALCCCNFVLQRLPKPEIEASSFLHLFIQYLKSSSTLHYTFGLPLSLSPHFSNLFLWYNFHTFFKMAKHLNLFSWNFLLNSTTFTILMIILFLTYTSCRNNPIYLSSIIHSNSSFFAIFSVFLCAYAFVMDLRHCLRHTSTTASLSLLFPKTSSFLKKLFYTQANTLITQHSTLTCPIYPFTIHSVNYLSPYLLKVGSQFLTTRNCLRYFLFIYRKWNMFWSLIPFFVLPLPLNNQFHTC